LDYWYYPQDSSLCYLFLIGYQGGEQVYQLKELWDWQQLKIQQQKIEKELKTGAPINALRQAKKDLEKITGYLQKTNTSIHQLEKKLKNKEMDCDNIKTNLRSLENKLYDGTVNNPKELQNLQYKNEMTIRDLSSAEEVLLALVMEQDECQLLRQQQQVVYEKAQNEFEKCRRSYFLWKKGLQQELERLDNAQRQLLEKIEAGLLETYNRLQKRFGSRVLVELEGDVCTGCHVRIPTSLRKEIKQMSKLVRCESCGRILFLNRGAGN
jgi:predicted  nucleic acid-binding Zn-ribbon protein